ncbi:MAG: hypothetical protein QN229_04235 [Desulfurococcaceae archaeon TW002]
MSIVGFLLVLAGLFVAFWGHFFIRLAVGLISGLWLGWLASFLATSILGEHNFISFFVGLMVFLIFFVLGVIKYRFIASFFLSVLIAYYIPLEAIIEHASSYSLSLTQSIILRFLIFLGLLIITYAAFKLLIGLIASSLGALLLYVGLVELKIPETPTLLLAALLFTTSLIRYVMKKK